MNRKRNPWPRLGLLFVLVVLVVVLCSCTPAQAYVDADRATYDEVAPDHEMYVRADPSLSAEQKARRLDLLKSWDLRTRKGEGR